MRRGHFISAAEVIEILPDFQVIVDGEKIGEVADMALCQLGVLVDVYTRDSHAALCRGEESASQAEDGGFSRAVRTNQAVNLVFWKANTQIPPPHHIALPPPPAFKPHHTSLHPNRTPN